MIRSTCRCLLAAVAVALAGCHVEPPAPPPYAARQVLELARWDVRSGDGALGVVRKLRILDPKGPLDYFRVEDTQGRWLGHATLLGRFSRRVPFQDDEEDLGVWSMAKGTAQLFEATSVELTPTAVDADARRSDLSPR